MATRELCKPAGLTPVEQMFVFVTGSQVLLPGRGCYKLKMEWAEVQALSHSEDEARISSVTDSCWSMSSCLHGDLQQDLAHVMKGPEAWPSCPKPWGGGEELEN